MLTMKKSTTYFTVSSIIMGAGIILSAFIGKHPVLIPLWIIILVSGSQLSLKGKAIYLLEQGISKDEYRVRFQKQKNITRIVQLLILITAFLIAFQLFFSK